MTYPLTQADFYKVSHKKFMREGCTRLYINLTARSGKYAKWADDERKVVFFGLQAFIKGFLQHDFNRQFFDRPKAQAVGYFKRRCDTALGAGKVDMAHIEALHDLGYLPLKIKALPEGSKVRFKVPLLTMTNTHDDFAWLVTYLETVLSQELWGPITSATTAYQFLKLCNSYAAVTVGNCDHVQFQCHDFSARGMFGRQAAALSGMGHLTCFTGTDTVAAIDSLEDYYFADPSTELVGTSVPASEHSVTSLGIAVDGELETLRRWITKDYPSGIVSIVSDTLDYWRVLTEYLPALKGEILNREKDALGLAKVVVRPDSGDPVRIICGYTEDEIVRVGKSIMVKDSGDNTAVFLTEDEVKGSIQLLWDTFGGTVNALGFKELNPAVGLIYGDSITLDRAKEIFERLKAKGFASSNVVFGLGSFTYQMVSRDTLGMAVKATYAVVDGKGVDLYKDPKTDDGTKRSARGLMRVDKIVGEYVMFDQQTPETEDMGELQVVFLNSMAFNLTNLQEVRGRIRQK